MNNRFVRIATLSKNYCKIHSTSNGIKQIGLPCLHTQDRPNRLPSRKIVYNTFPQPKYTATEQERDEFDSIFPCIVKDLTDPYQAIPEVQSHFVKFLNANVPNHKHGAGLLVLTAYKEFAHPDDLTAKNINLAYVLGWCVHLFYSYWHINDDLIDSSDIRNGSLSWHNNDEIGLAAINDSIFAAYSLYVLLKKYFSTQDFYLKATEWFQEVSLATVIGQALDMKCLKNGKPRLDIFTMERYELLSKHKANYLAMLPIILAMHFANKNDVNLYKQVQSVLIELGNYFAAQNDMVDCYGDPLVTGKKGDDIREGRCTWFIVKALQKATPLQMQILKQYYGNNSVESDLEVKLLYEDLGIFEEFLEFEKESLDKLSKRIKEMPDNFPVTYFLKLLGTFYGHRLKVGI